MQRVTDRRKIAILMASLSGGGAERSMIKLAGGLAARGLGVDLVVSRAVGPLIEEVPSTVNLVELDSRTLFAVAAISRYLRAERPDALLSSVDFVNIVSLWARRVANVPVRHVLNEQNTLSFRREHRSQLRFVPALAKRFYPWADAITAVSDGVARDLVEVTGIPRERIDVAFNPVVSPDLMELKEAPIDDPWFATGEPPVLIAVGRLTPQKDFPMLLRAFARVVKARPARLLILGEGDERKRLERTVGELGLEDSVRLPGFNPNPYAFMSRAAAFVLSSRWEGLPTVLIEALACNLPVVSTDCRSGPQTILDGGRFGTLVPVGDDEALATGILETLDSGQRPVPESWQPYTLDAVVDRYLEILFPGGG